MGATMTKHLLCLFAAVAMIPAGVNAGQSPQAQKETKPQPFEVATIKPSDPANRGNGCFIRGQPGGQTFVGQCVTLHAMITWTYRISDSQVTGEPDWLKTDLWDFQAKAEHPITRAE